MPSATSEATDGCPGSARPIGAAAEPDPLAPSAAAAIVHMNADHADALVLYCKAFSKATDITSATMTGVDRYGFECRPRPPRVRAPFASRLPRRSPLPEEVRAALVAMVKDARARLG